MTNRPYKIIMSRGDNIQIDADELGDVLDERELEDYFFRSYHATNNRT